MSIIDKMDEWQLERFRDMMDGNIQQEPIRIRFYPGDRESFNIIGPVPRLGEKVSIHGSRLEPEEEYNYKNVNGLGIRYWKVVRIWWSLYVHDSKMDCLLNYPRGHVEVYLKPIYYYWENVRDPRFYLYAIRHPIRTIKRMRRILKNNP